MRDLRLTAAVVAALLCLVACRAEQPEAVAPTPTAAAPEVAVSEAVPARVPVADPAASSPMPPASPDDEEFVGWFIERGGSSQLLACGQSMSLPIANPAFLRELEAKLNRRDNAPVYVRLRVRLAAGSQLEVTEVVQFGVEEATVVDCSLNQ